MLSRRQQSGRKTGIDILGDVTWGTHLCLFYETEKDLIDILVPYLKAGLENNEFCMWVTSEPLSEKKARDVLSTAIADFDRYLEKGQIQIIPDSEWYLKDGTFNLNRVLNGWIDKLSQALSDGFDGIRVTGSGSGFEQSICREFADYEKEVNKAIGKYKMIAICSYCVDKYGASEIIDVVSSHQSALIRREGKWEVIKSARLEKAEEKIKLFSEAIAGAIDAIAITDMEGVITYVNHAKEKMYGYEKGELIGKHVSVLNPKLEMVEEMISTLMETGSWNGEILQQKKNKETFPALLALSTVRDEKGNPIAMMGAVRDITERKRAKKVLKVERDKLTAILDSMADGVYIVNQENDIEYINPVLQKEFGPVKENKCYEYFHDRKEVCPWCKNQDVFAGKTVRWEWYSFKNQRTYDLIDTPLRNSDGSISKLEIFRDITDRKRNEEILRKSEEKYHSLITNIPDVTWTADNKGNTTFVSPNIEKVYGYTPGKIYKEGDRLWFGRVHPDDVEKLKESYEALFEKGTQFDIEYRIKRKDGQWIWLHDRSITTYEKDGVVYADGILSDVTERKKIREELRASEQKFRDLTETTTNWLWEVDKDGVYTYVSPKVNELLGYEVSEVLGKTPFDLMPREEAKKIGKFFKKKVINKETFYKLENVNRHKDGHLVVLETNGIPIFDEKGQLKGYRGIDRDITEQKRTEKILKETERLAAKGQLAALIAHEINNPLAGIKNSFLLIKDAIAEDHHYYQYVGLIDKEIERISDIVRQMFDLYRPNQAPTDFSVNNAIHEVVALLEGDCHKHKVIISIDSSNKALKLPEALLRQVLFNIVKNAVEASPPGAEVKIAASITEDALTLTFCDCGSGIPEQAKSRIFEPSFTTKNGRTTAGLGLGLSVSKNIVEGMGGSIRFESKAGEGTVFIIIIPLSWA